MKLYIVGIGPGNLGEITPRALAAIAASQVVVGYRRYIELIQALLEGKTVVAGAMTGEVGRCREAIRHALEGKTVAVVSSGDAGVYGMAGLVCQLAEPHPLLDIEVIPGITAACSAAAVLGAPLTHDFASISLSDLLTPWEIIQKRLIHATLADFVLCLYNPASQKRQDLFRQACETILEHRAGHTPCGVARNIGRDGETRAMVTLEQLQYLTVDMLTTVMIGNSETRVMGGRLVTPRGYRI